MDYKKPRHAETLIEAFYTYKQHELFCDATLVVDEEQIGTKFINDTVLSSTRCVGEAFLVSVGLSIIWPNFPNFLIRSRASSDNPLDLNR